MMNKLGFLFGLAVLGCTPALGSDHGFCAKGTFEFARYEVDTGGK